MSPFRLDSASMAKLLAVAAVCLGVCRLLFFLSTNYLSDGRFITNFAMEIGGMSLSILLAYQLSKRFVFCRAQTQSGAGLRYCAAAVLCIACFVGLTWLIQSLGFSAAASRASAGVAVFLLSVPLQTRFVFGAAAYRENRTFRNLANIVLMLALALSICGVQVLTYAVMDLYASTLEESRTSTFFDHDDGRPAGRFTVHADIDAIGADATGEGVDYVWDDSWFFLPSDHYNHELARAALVLSSLANSESKAYGGKPVRTTATDMFDRLGFDEVQTSSFVRRSTIMDNVATLAAGATDTVAYAIATKRIQSTDSAVKTLIVVAVRGSYGSEWMSNFNVSGKRLPGYEDDHVGFSRASAVVMKDLEKTLRDHSGEDVALLFCGHSRGGSVSNLLAARLDEQGFADRLFSYTFASPATTLCAEDTRRSPLYGNIFNVMLPSDVVPRLPLSSWGFGRYGTDVLLPGTKSATFEQLEAAMSRYHLEAFGKPCGSDPGDAARIDEGLQAVEQSMPDSSGLGNLNSVLTLARFFAVDINTVKVLASHYLPTYLSWMAVTPPSSLSFSGGA